MDMRNIDLNMLKTAPLSSQKPTEQVDLAQKDTDKQDEGFEKKVTFEDVLSKFIDEKIEEQAKIDKGIVDPSISGQVSSQMKMTMVDGFQRGGEKSDWNPAGIN